MELHINETDRIVEIWLSNAEKADAVLRESLEPVCTAYKEKKYYVAVFESGKRDLFGHTRDLLLNNRINKVDNM